MNAREIELLIAAGLECEQVQVEGDGRHWFAVIVSSVFEGKSRVQRQRLVNAAVHEKMITDELHALSMRTFTPAEWAQVQDQNS